MEMTTWRVHPLSEIILWKLMLVGEFEHWRMKKSTYYYVEQTEYGIVEFPFHPLLANVVVLKYRRSRTGIVSLFLPLFEAHHKQCHGTIHWAILGHWGFHCPLIVFYNVSEGDRRKQTCCVSLYYCRILKRASKFTIYNRINGEERI